MAQTQSSGAQRSAALLGALGMLAACAENEAPDDALRELRAPGIARIVPVAEALAGAHVPTLDPATMDEAEIRNALEVSTWCRFRYTTAGKPVAAIGVLPDGASRGVVKLNGHLIVLPAAWRSDMADGKGAFVLHADPVRMTVIPDAGGRILEEGRSSEANAIFEIGERLRVGYRGYLQCLPAPSPVSPGPT